MTVEDKLVEQVTGDTATALQAHMDVIESAIQGHITAIDNAHAKMKQSNTKVADYDRGLKTKLDKGTKAYDNSIKRLFQLDDRRKIVFWWGLISSIATPIVFLLNLFL